MRGTLLALLMTAPALFSADPPDPAKASGPLPDVLTDLAGKPITSAEQWTNAKPLLLAAIQKEMYGTLPKPARPMADVTREDRDALGGKAIVREVRLSVGPPGTPLTHLLLILPKSETTVPIFLGINFCGNHAVLDDPKVHLPTVWMYPNYPGVKDNKATEAGRGSAKETWPVETILARGYGLATFYAGDLDPDRAGVREGVQPHILPKGWEESPDRPGTVAVWAWGAQRALDFLVTQKEIDPKRVAIVGHSRLGKTALLAGATDERFALVIPHQSGCGGAAPSRGTVGESVKRINEGFPHWFNAKFKTYGLDPTKLPFDQHHVMALVAPRPLLVCNAAEDQWANPSGQFRAAEAAEPVYKLFGVGWGDKPAMPKEGELYLGTLGYYYRAGKHAMTPADWKAYLEFADKHLKTKK